MSGHKVTLLNVLARVGIALGCFIATNFAVIRGWALVDSYRARSEVVNFINDHQELVNACREKPGVHEFILEISPNHAGRLLIRCDVEDQETFEEIRSDLEKVSDLTFLPIWDANIRLNGESGGDFGYRAEAIGELVKAMFRCLVAFVVSILVFACMLWKLGLISP